MWPVVWIFPDVLAHHVKGGGHRLGKVDQLSEKPSCAPIRFAGGWKAARSGSLPSRGNAARRGTGESVLTCGRLRNHAEGRAPLRPGHGRREIAAGILSLFVHPRPAPWLTMRKYQIVRPLPRRHFRTGGPPSQWPIDRQCSHAWAAWSPLMTRPVYHQVLFRPGGIRPRRLVCPLCRSKNLEVPRHEGRLRAPAWARIASNVVARQAGGGNGRKTARRPNE